MEHMNTAYCNHGSIFNRIFNAIKYAWNDKLNDDL